jgi:predicted ATPase with chaperone activity
VALLGLPITSIYAQFKKLNIMQLSDYEIKSLHRLGESIHQGRWSNDGIVQLIKLAGGFLNLQTVADFAEKNKISYQAAKKDTGYRKNIKIFNVKFIIDND